MTHYENFPVASLLCPAPLRPVIRAIYAFARTATDDIADEGDAPATQRLQDLAAFEADLQAIAQGQPPARVGLRCSCRCRACSNATSCR